MKYNHRKKYNVNLFKDGLGYNGITPKKIIEIYDTFKFSEGEIILTAQIFNRDDFKVSDAINFFALFKHSDEFNLTDEEKLFALYSFNETLKLSDKKFVTAFFEILDKFNVLESNLDLSVFFDKKDNFNLSESTFNLVNIKQNDIIKINDDKEVLALLSLLDKFYMKDKDPDKAISDFIVGVQDDKDNAYDWLLPFDLIVDWRSSSLQIMPQSESDYIDQPYMDGSIIENTTYKNRSFNFVGYSELGLTIAEKEELKRDIARILDSTKKHSKKLTFQRSSTSFDVKYSGSAVIEEAPSFIKATIPFECSPYGYPLFEQEVEGSGLLVNNGDKESGCVHYIYGAITNPSFKLGQITYKWNGTVPLGSTLVINHNDYTCYLMDKHGNKTNAITKLTGAFQSIPAKQSVNITAYNDLSSKLLTKFKEQILWMGD